MTGIEKQIKKEIKRLNAIFAEIEVRRKDIVAGLIEDAAFMRVTLMDLKKQVNEEGAIDEMCQGEYSILRVHPAAQMYNTMIQRYAGVIKQLTDLFPKEVPKDVGDDFDTFIGGRDG